LFLFDNYPKKVSQQYYSDARSKIIEFYAKNKDIISIYEYGSVSSPGVSDLDIILVLRDKIESKEDDLNFSNIDSEVHSLVVDGTVIKMSEKIFNKICHFDKLNLKKLYGKDLSIDILSEEDQSILELISVVDWLPERILRLTKILNNEVINIANVLCILHSFSYSIIKINNITDYPSKSDGTLSVIKSLRNDWHNLANPEKILVTCIKNSITLGYTYLLMFMKFLESQDIYQNINTTYPDDLTLELFENHYIKFVSVSQYSDMESSAIKSSNSLKSFVHIPDFFYPHFYHLSIQNGELPIVIKGKINSFTTISEKSLSSRYKKVLTNKINLAEKNAQFLKFNNLKKGLIRYGFHLRY